MLDYDLEFSEQTVQECAGQVVQRLNSDLAFVRNLILVKEVIPSLKVSKIGSTSNHSPAQKRAACSNGHACTLQKFLSR